MSHGPTPTNPAVVVVSVVASVISGMLVALQSRINGEFGLALGNGALAAAISFTIGLVMITLAMGLSKRGRAGLSSLRGALTRRELPWWSMLGGLGGAFLVLTQGLTAGILGVALFSIAVVTGQSLGAVAIDSRGWFGVAKVALGPRRIIGAIIVLGGVALAVDIQPGALTQSSGLFLLPLAAGFGTGFQQAVNGRVKTVAASALTATFMNFLVGAIALVVVYLVALPFTGVGVGLASSWWLWTGGLIGASFILVQVTTVNIIGVLGLGVSLISGQLIGSIILDAVAPLATSGLTQATLIGALVTLVGAVLVTLGRRPG